MKKLSKIIIFLVSILLLFTFSIQAFAAVYVKGYFRKDGTYVAPHYRSNPDGNPYNNWSFPGNTNPYTGKVAPGNADTYLDNYYNKNSLSNDFFKQGIDFSNYQGSNYSEPKNNNSVNIKYKGNIPSYKISLRNIVFNNRDLYPFVEYNNITYLPLATYYLNLLGISLKNNANGLYLTKKEPTADITEGIDYNNGTNIVLTEYPKSLYINEREYNSRIHDYPILFYKNIVYIPMIYDLFYNEFEIEVNWDKVQGLNINRVKEEKNLTKNNIDQLDLKTIFEYLGYFTFGSTKQEVINLMGNPDINNSDYFRYGLSSVYFDNDGKVLRWDNYGDLKVTLGFKDPTFGPVTIDSSMVDVINSMGTPDGIYFSPKFRFRYGLSYIYFDNNGKVSYWDNYGDLNIILGSKINTTASIKEGDSVIDVTNTFGTPDGLRYNPNHFRYGLTYVFFDDNWFVTGLSN